MSKYAWAEMHDWRERAPSGKAGYVCLRCGRRASRASQMGLLPKCSPSLVPVSWFPSKAQAGLDAVDLSWAP